MVAFVIVIGGAFAVRLATFERFLPVLDYTDETWYYGFAQQYRGNFDIYLDMTAHTAPPVQAFLSARVLDISDALNPNPWVLPSRHMAWLRGWAVIMGTLTTAFVATSGWRLTGSVVGLLPAVVWAFAPKIVDINSLAIADPYMFMFVALALMAAILAWEQDSYLWLLLSLLAGIAAIFSKFWIASAVVPFCLVTLVFVRWDFKRSLTWLVVYIVIAIAGAFMLMRVVDPLGTAQGLREVDTFRNDGLRNAFSLDRNWINLRFALYPMIWGVFVVTAGLGVIASVYNYRREVSQLRLGRLLILLMYCVLTLMLASTFTVSRIDAGKIRHVLPTTLGLLLIWSMLLHQIETAVRHFVSGRSSWVLRVVPILVPIVVLGIYIPAFAVENAQLIQNYRKTYVNEVVWNYTDSSLPREGLVWLEDSSVLATLWNRPWGGYPGNKPFEWWNEAADSIADQSPSELIERNITHMIFTNRDYAERMDSPQIAGLLDEMLLVKTIAAPDDVFLLHNAVLEGVEDVYVYRVMPPQNPVNVAYGNAIRLVGYDLSDETVGAGETVQLRLFWQTDERPPIDYSMFVHVYPNDSYDIATQHDGSPVSAQRGTSTWDDPDEVLISEIISLTMPTETTPGDYRLAIGLYDLNSGQRLDTTDPNGFHVIPVVVTE